MTRSKLSYAFSYGFLGGALHSRDFRKLLHEKGYVPALSIMDADIIIAHSAGCWMVPESVSPKLLVLVGMPLAKDKLHKTLKAANKENIRAFKRNRHLLKGAKVGLYSAYYGLVQPKRNKNIASDAKKNRPVAQYSSLHTVFIVNKNDPWPSAEQVQELPDVYNWAFIGLAGAHDDIWEHPSHYVSIISHYSKYL